MYFKQPRGSDGKYATYSAIVRFVKAIIRGIFK